MLSVPVVSVAEVSDRLGDPAWVVVDTRFNLMDPDAGRRAYEAGHLPGAVYADLDRDLAGPVGPSGGRHPLPDVAGLGKTLGRFGIGRGTRVVVYDDAGGAIAARLWWLLRWLGHDAVAAAGRRIAGLAGRPPAARSAGAGAAPGALRGAAGRHARRPPPKRCRGLMDGGLLLDARDASRFLGRHEPIDPVAGHVPGAVNAPFQDNLDQQGRFLAPEALASHYGALLDGARPDRVACMCGSGVTACHLIVALERAGLPGAALYVGSWSDWISGDRPIGREGE